MSQEPLLLTPEEVAELLRISATDVISLIEDGSIGGMAIAGHWRIRADSLKEFLREGLQQANVQAIQRALHDPAYWAKMLRESPDLMTSIEQEDCRG